MPTGIEIGFLLLCAAVVLIAYRVEKLQQKIMHGEKK